MSVLQNMSTEEKVSLLKELYNDIAAKGQDGDTMLAHINPYEAEILKAYGGSGTINPQTGLPEYKGAVSAVTDAFSKVSTFVSNIPGMQFIADYMGPIGFVMQGYSYLQQRKEGKRMKSAEQERVRAANKLEEEKQKVYQANLNKERRRIAREEYIKKENILARIGTTGLSPFGTSSFQTGLGSLSTQAIGETTYLAGVGEAGEQMSRTTQQMGQAASDVFTAGQAQAGWKEVASLGGSLMKFGSSNPYETSKTDKLYSNLLA